MTPPIGLALNINPIIICMLFATLFFFYLKLNSVGAASSTKDAPGKQRFTLSFLEKILYSLS